MSKPPVEMIQKEEVKDSMGYDSEEGSNTIAAAAISNANLPSPCTEMDADGSSDRSDRGWPKKDATTTAKTSSAGGDHHFAAVMTTMKATTRFLQQLPLRRKCEGGGGGEDAFLVCYDLVSQLQPGSSIEALKALLTRSSSSTPSSSTIILDTLQPHPKTGLSVTELAAENEHWEATRVLFSYGVQGREVLATELFRLMDRAIRNDWVMMVDVILDAGVMCADAVIYPSQRHTLLMYAAQKGKVSTMD